MNNDNNISINLLCDLSDYWGFRGNRFIYLYIFEIKYQFIETTISFDYMFFDQENTYLLEELINGKNIKIKTYDNKTFIKSDGNYVTFANLTDIDDEYDDGSAIKRDYSYNTI